MPNDDMRKQGLTKVQLFLLFGAVGLVMWRMSNRTGGVEGLVVISDMSDGHVYRTGMRVENDTDIVINMTGSFETDAERALIATYGWIVNADDRSLVWIANRSQYVRDGVLGVVTDSIHITAGSYDVFYTTEGPTANSRSNAPFLGLKPFWTNDASQWSLSIAQPTGADIDNPDVFHADYHGFSPESEDLLWTTGIVGNRDASTHLFRVSAQAEVSIYAIGEICSRECDFGYIENVQNGTTVWMMNWENTMPAGGAETNRIFQGTITLDPGIYRAGFQSNGSHSGKSWRANPPHDPDGWGMTLSNVPRANIVSYDPWTQTTPFIDMTGIGDDELHKKQFKVNKKSTFLISAMGEITSQSSVYDYGWLERNDSHETIWKMSYRNSNIAGGDSKNRVETVFLELEPGTYTVYYQTDNSHSFEAFNSNRSKPDNPERWGLAVFPVSVNDSNEDDYTVLESSWGEEDQMDDTVSELFSGRESTVLIDFTRIGNDSQISETFEIERAIKVFVTATGELSTGSRQDYGWIEDAETGERVWEMTAKNTKHAGGRRDNRIFEGLVRLPEGRYIARYVSDFSHAYGDFGEDGPDDESLWGMRIVRNDR